MKLEIKKARPEEYDKIRYFYYSLIDALEGTRYHPKWQRDVYPAPEELRAAVEAVGMKAVRLDVLKGNLPAEKLYEGEGFTYVDTVKLFYEDTGRVDFKMYEYLIS